MTTVQLHRLMSLTDRAIEALEEHDYSKAQVMKGSFESLQEELYGPPLL